MEFSRCTQAGGPPYEKYRAPPLSGIWHGLSKLNSVRSTYVEVDVISRRTQSPDEDLSREININKQLLTGWAPTGIIAPVSLERR
jgi:hypothetical protein